MSIFKHKKPGYQHDAEATVAHSRDSRLIAGPFVSIIPETEAIMKLMLASDSGPTSTSLPQTDEQRLTISGQPFTPEKIRSIDSNSKAIQDTVLSGYAKYTPENGTNLLDVYIEAHFVFADAVSRMVSGLRQSEPKAKLETYIYKK
jgi:hypothetical protein